VRDMAWVTFQRVTPAEVRTVASDLIDASWVQSLHKGDVVVLPRGRFLVESREIALRGGSWTRSRSTGPTLGVGADEIPHFQA
jgi:hypothetical protein